MFPSEMPGSSCRRCPPYCVGFVLRDGLALKRNISEEVDFLFSIFFAGDDTEKTEFFLEGGCRRISRSICSLSVERSFLVLMDRKDDHWTKRSSYIGPLHYSLRENGPLVVIATKGTAAATDLFHLARCCSKQLKKSSVFD